MNQIKKITIWLTLALLLISVVGASSTLAATQQQSGSNGLEGTVPGSAPTQAATIDVPKNNQTFSNIPITVSGLCPNNTLVEIYDNNVFFGSVDCKNGSYSLQTSLFDNRNDLVARVYDTLNQAGPDSNTVTVFFSTSVPTTGPRISLTTQYAKRGADPGSILSWPITLSGGTGPYALSVDWGDKSAPDLISQQIPGNVELEHTYAQAGVYKVTIRASDANGNVAFLQIIGIGNGPIQQSTTPASSILTSEKTKVLWWPIILFFIMAMITYWLGQRNQLEAIKNRLRQGERPF